MAGHHEPNHMTQAMNRAATMPNLIHLVTFTASMRRLKSSANVSLSFISVISWCLSLHFAKVVIFCIQSALPYIIVTYCNESFPALSAHSRCRDWPPENFSKKIHFATGWGIGENELIEKFSQKKWLKSLVGNWKRRNFALAFGKRTSAEVAERKKVRPTALNFVKNRIKILPVSKSGVILPSCPLCSAQTRKHERAHWNYYNRDEVVQENEYKKQKCIGSVNFGLTW